VIKAEFSASLLQSSQITLIWGSDDQETFIIHNDTVVLLYIFVETETFFWILW